MSFYYFMASQPAVELGGPVPQSLAGFRAEVARLLPPAVTAALDAVLDGSPVAASDAFARAWFDAEVQIRNAVATVRAGRRGVEAAPHLRPQAGFSLYLAQAVAEAFGKPNPMERELALDRVRWSVLEELARESAFGLEAVLAYGLKLKLAERWTQLTEPAGRTALLDTVKRVREAGAAVVSADGARV